MKKIVILFLVVVLLVVLGFFYYSYSNRCTLNHKQGCDISCNSNYDCKIEDDACINQNEDRTRSLWNLLGVFNDDLLGHLIKCKCINNQCRTLKDNCLNIYIMLGDIGISEAKISGNVTIAVTEGIGTKEYTLESYKIFVNGQDRYSVTDKPMGPLDIKTFNIGQLKIGDKVQVAPVSGSGEEEIVCSLSQEFIVKE
jgi:hypothetical protein